MIPPNNTAAGKHFVIFKKVCLIILSHLHTIKAGNSYFPTFENMEVSAMSKSTVLINDARVMSKGQVTIPKNIREALGVSTGDRVTFILENDSVRVINSAVYAMQKFQEQMKGQAKKAGFTSEEDVSDWITNTRREENAE